MDVAATTVATAQQTISPKAKVASSDFTTFLKLLTAQLKNQDPLKPLDSTQFVAQLASFSSVEQQVKTNDALAGIQATLGGTPGSSLSTWIGAEVRALKDADFTGSPINVFTAPDPTADRAQLIVKNAVGQMVQTTALPLAAGVAQWAGVDKNGAPLSNGRYSLVVESYQNGELINSHQAAIYDQVREARVDKGQITLVFGDGSLMPASDVTAVREPDNMPG